MLTMGTVAAPVGTGFSIVPYARIGESSPSPARLPHGEHLFGTTSGMMYESVAVQSPRSRANTTTPFAGITIFADAAKPCAGLPLASIAPPFPATIGFTQLS